MSMSWSSQTTSVNSHHLSLIEIIDEIERRVFLMFGVQDFLVNNGVNPYYNSLYTPQNPTERRRSGGPGARPLDRAQVRSDPSFGHQTDK
jgi:hypothetical protein